MKKVYFLIVGCCLLLVGNTWAGGFIRFDASELDDVTTYSVVALDFPVAVLEGELLWKPKFKFVGVDLLYKFNGFQLGPKIYSNSVGDDRFGVKFGTRFPTPFETKTVFTFSYLFSTDGSEDMMESFLATNFFNIGKYDISWQTYYHDDGVGNLQIRIPKVARQFGDFGVFVMPNIHLKEGSDTTYMLIMGVSF